jgi:hypothetical protein
MNLHQTKEHKMSDPCDFCPTDDCDFGTHTPGCPNADPNAPLTPTAARTFLNALTEALLHDAFLPYAETPTESSIRRDLAHLADNFEIRN